jgi:hypothetical protein
MYSAAQNPETGLVNSSAALQGTAGHCRTLTRCTENGQQHCSNNEQQPHCCQNARLQVLQKWTAALLFGNQYRFLLSQNCSCPRCTFQGCPTVVDSKHCHYGSPQFEQTANTAVDRPGRGLITSACAHHRTAKQLVAPYVCTQLVTSN